VYIEAYDNVSGKTVRMNVSQLVVYDQYGNPLALAALCGPATYVGHFRDKDFSKALSALGIHKTVIVEPLRQDTALIG